MNVLVTGATGRIGNVLVRELLKKKINVRVLVSPKGDRLSLDGLKVDFFEGDLTDYSSVRDACKGVSIVYHLAALISIGGANKDLVYKVNIDGTNNIINACLECNVKKLVYVSTIHAIHEPKKGDLITEKEGFDVINAVGDYDKSKAIASINVLEAVKTKGLNAVIVCPTGVIGPYDFQVSFFSQYIVNCANKKQSFFIDGEYDFVDVRDVVQGVINSERKGRIGEIYILSGRKISVAEFNIALKEITGINPPMIKVPYRLSYFAAMIYSFFNKNNFFTPYAVFTLHRNCDISHAKASKELYYHPREFKESFKDMLYWFKSKGVINF